MIRPQPLKPMFSASLKASQIQTFHRCDESSACLDRGFVALGRKTKVWCEKSLYIKILQRCKSACRAGHVEGSLC